MLKVCFQVASRKFPSEFALQVPSELTTGDSSIVNPAFFNWLCQLLAARLLVLKGAWMLLARPTKSEPSLSDEFIRGSVKFIAWLTMLVVCPARLLAALLKGARTSLGWAPDSSVRSSRISSRGRNHRRLRYEVCGWFLFWERAETRECRTMVQLL